MKLKGMIVYCPIYPSFAEMGGYRKYRVLDDCSRLRDIVKTLPPKRHFIPSLLIFCWTEGADSYPATDFFDMVHSLSFRFWQCLDRSASGQEICVREHS